MTAEEKLPACAVAGGLERRRKRSKVKNRSKVRLNPRYCGWYGRASVIACQLL